MKTESLFTIYNMSEFSYLALSVMKCDKNAEYRSNHYKNSGRNRYTNILNLPIDTHEANRQCRFDLNRSPSLFAHVMMISPRQIHCQANAINISFSWFHRSILHVSLENLK